MTPSCGLYLPIRVDKALVNGQRQGLHADFSTILGLELRSLIWYGFWNMYSLMALELDPFGVNPMRFNSWHAAKTGNKLRHLGLRPCAPY